MDIFLNRGEERSSDSPSKQPWSLEVAHRDRRKELQAASSSGELSYEEIGRRRLEHICSQQPTNIEEYNYQTIHQFNERYINSVPIYDVNNKCWDLATFVKETNKKKRDLRDSCYECKWYTDGRFKNLRAAKKRKKNIIQDKNIEVYDDDIKFAGTVPLSHSKVMFNQILSIIKNNKRNIDIVSIEDIDIINKDAKSVIDHYLPENEAEKTFSCEDPGYIAIVGTDLGVGKWYLIMHHYKNKVISKVTVQRYEDESDETTYNIIYHIEGKQ